MTANDADAANEYPEANGPRKASGGMGASHRRTITGKSRRYSLRDWGNRRNLINDRRGWGWYQIGGTGGIIFNGILQHVPIVTRVKKMYCPGTTVIVFVFLPARSHNTNVALNRKEGIFATPARID